MNKLTELETDKTLTQWELSNVLEMVAKHLKDLPHSVVRKVEFSEEEAWKKIENLIIGVNNRLIELEKALDASDVELEKAVDDHYHNSEKKIYELNKRLRELPEIAKIPQIPYNFDKMIECAERLESMSDTQWERLIQITKIFVEKE